MTFNHIAVDLRGMARPQVARHIGRQFDLGGVTCVSCFHVVACLARQSDPSAAAVFLESCLSSKTIGKNIPRGLC